MPALPKIRLLLSDPECALAAMCVLRSIDPEGEADILSLTNVMGIRDGSPSMPAEALRASAVATLSHFGRKASGAAPLLLDQMNSTNDQIRATAAVALVRVGVPAETAVPLILKSMSRTLPAQNAGLPGEFEYKRCIQMNAWVLGEYGSQAHAALPALSNLLSYPLENNVQREVKNAIAKIAGNTNGLPP